MRRNNWALYLWLNACFLIWIWRIILPNSF